MAAMYRPEDAPKKRVALVLGCGPGSLLDKRMDAACALVVHGCVESLLVSGMPKEMPTMRGRARSVLPDERILVDEGAVRTLSSMIRARRDFALDEILVVTQAYHLPRALLLAHAAGLRADGVIANGTPSPYQWLRERGATLRAWADVARLVVSPPMR